MVSRPRDVSVALGTLRDSCRRRLRRHRARDLVGDKPNEPDGGGSCLRVGQTGRSSRQSTSARDVDEPGPLGQLLPRPGRRLLLRSVRLCADGPEGTAHRQHGVCEFAGTGLVKAPLADLVGVALRGRDELGPGDLGDDRASVGSVQGDPGLADEIPVLEPRDGPFVPQMERLARRRSRSCRSMRGTGR